MFAFSFIYPHIVHSMRHVDTYVAHGLFVQNGWTDRDAIWGRNSRESKEPYVSWGSRSLPQEGAHLRGLCAGLQ